MQWSAFRQIIKSDAVFLLIQKKLDKISTESRDPRIVKKLFYQGSITSNADINQLLYKRLTKNSLIIFLLNHYGAVEALLGRFL